MSVRNALLALLDDGAKYGFQLKKDFEQATSKMWPINVGQIYTTLGRLVRDGLVAEEGSDDEGRPRYRRTDAGREELAGWFDVPRPAERPERDDLVIKVAMALRGPPELASRVITAQRAEGTRALQLLVREQRSAGDELTAAAVWDAAVTRTEAEIRWLDLTAARLRNSAARPSDHNQTTQHGTSASEGASS